MAEGTPKTKAAKEDAAHFLVRMVHRSPHEISIYAAGPMTDLALAIAIDPHFAELSKELIVMAGRINPNTHDPRIPPPPPPEFKFLTGPAAAPRGPPAHRRPAVLMTAGTS